MEDAVEEQTASAHHENVEGTSDDCTARSHCSSAPLDLSLVKVKISSPVEGKATLTSAFQRTRCTIRTALGTFSQRQYQTSALTELANQEHCSGQRQSVWLPKGNRTMHEQCWWLLQPKSIKMQRRRRRSTPFVLT